MHGPDVIEERLPTFVRCVTLPRSGHHFLAHMAIDLLGPDRVDYRGRGDAPSRADARPDARYLLWKSHDRDLALPGAMPDCRSVVQVREPAGQICSELERVRKKRPDFPQDDPDVLFAWLVTSGVYWRGFMRKWAEPERADVTVLWYDALLAEPGRALGAFAALFGVAADRGEIARVVDAHRGLVAQPLDSPLEPVPFVPRTDARSPFIPGDLLDAYVGSCLTGERATPLGAAIGVVEDVGSGACDGAEALARADAIASPRLVRMVAAKRRERAEAATHST